MHAPDLPAHWDIFRQLHAVVDSRRVDSRTLGREEALTALLDRFGMGCDPPDPADVQRQFDYLCANRAAKYRRRARLDRHIAEMGQVILTERTTASVALKELVEMVRCETPDADWRILRMLAEGFTYLEVADWLGVSVGNLKSRASRRRHHLRSSPIGRRVQNALAAR
jgi:hypothetical protein